MSVPFYPPSLSTCVLWLDASDPGTLGVTDGRITRWDDKTMFYNSTSFVTAQGPLLSNLNGLSSLFFQANAGTAQVLQGPLSSFQQYNIIPQTSFVLSVFAVGTVSSPTQTGFFQTLVGAGARNRFYGGAQIGQLSTAQANLCVFPTSTINSNYTALSSFNSPFCFSHACIQARISLSSFLSVNGDPLTLCASGIGTGFSTIGAYTLGGPFTASPDFRNGWTGHLGEVILYATTDFLPWGERQLIEGYLASKWGFQTLLPTTHPYRSAPAFPSKPTSALAITTLSTSRAVVLPALSSLGTQLFWTTPTNQVEPRSTVALIATSNEYMGLEPSLVLNERAQSALLVSTSNSNSWIVHSKAVNNPMYTCTLPTTPYRRYQPLYASDFGFATGPGTSVAMSTDARVIATGVWAANAVSPLGVRTSGTGGLYVFTKDPVINQYSTFQGELFASDPVFGARLGAQVAMTDDANYIFATASNYNGTVSAQGSVYVYKKTTGTDVWGQVTRIDPPVADRALNLKFGKSIATSSNGDYLFIGANVIINSYAGAIYPYKRIAETDTWVDLPRILNPYTASPLSNGFADAVVCTPDATTVCTGTPYLDFIPFSLSLSVDITSAGGGIFYRKNSSTDQWDLAQQIIPSDFHPNMDFGLSPAISRDGLTLAFTTGWGQNQLASPSTYLFRRETVSDLWNQRAILCPFSQSRITDYGYTTFTTGSVCAISESADYILVGADGGTTIGGQSFLYQKQAGTDRWEQRTILLPFPTEIVANGFGAGIAMTPSGSHLAIGQTGGVAATRTRGIHIFEQSTVQTQAVTNTYTFVNTSTITNVLCLPHPSTNPGQVLYIKDATNSANRNPIQLSTTGGSYLLSSLTSFSMYGSNMCLQLQSDGSNTYRMLNLYSGRPGPQPLAFNFKSFWVQGSVSTAVSNYAIPVSMLVRYEIAQNLLLQNIFFRDSDFVTDLPFWIEANTFRNTEPTPLFWVSLPYIPPYPMQRQFFVCWNSNVQYKERPNDTFLFFDDFKGAAGDSPDPTKWYTLSQGSPGSSLQLTGIQSALRTQAVSNANTNATLLLRTPTLSNNFAIRARTYLSSFTTISFAQTSTLQFLPTGGQSNWWWTALGGGYTYQPSTPGASRRFLYSQAQGAAAVSLGCNTAGFNQFFPYVYELSYTDRGRLEVGFTLSNIDSITGKPILGQLVLASNRTFLDSNKYVAFSQGAIAGGAFTSSIYEFIAIRPYQFPEPVVGSLGPQNVL